ncbi:AAA family ATPase [Nitrospirillum amazonense]|uniref:AAA family ATPase n=1 Tax=Nitrospirillum amazonense TaxID=28077 RepID=UPI0011AACA91
MRTLVVMVDGVAMMDRRTYAQLMERAAEAPAKVVLVGDDRQARRHLQRCQRPAR